MYLSGNQQFEYTLSAGSLQQENVAYRNTGGVSGNNRTHGFLPAFLDTRSGKIYLSRFANGRPAPIHLIDGLPAALSTGDGDGGSRIKNTVTSGFVRDQRFYTRAQAAEQIGRDEEDRSQPQLLRGG